MNAFITLTKSDIAPYRHSKPVVRLFKKEKDGKEKWYAGHVQDIVFESGTLFICTVPLVTFINYDEDLPIHSDESVLIQEKDIPLITPEKEKLQTTLTFTHCRKLCLETDIRGLKGLLNVISPDGQVILSYRLQDVYAVGCLIHRHERLTEIHKSTQRPR